MQSFEEVLKVEFERDAHDFGGDPAKAMSKALKKIRTENLWWFRFYAALIVLILILLIVLVALYARKPHEMAIAAGAVGFSLWKPFEFILKAWEGWRKSELMMALMEGVSSSQIQGMFDKIVEKY